MVQLMISEYRIRLLFSQFNLSSVVAAEKVVDGQYSRRMAPFYLVVAGEDMNYSPQR